MTMEQMMTCAGAITALAAAVTVLGRGLRTLHWVVEGIRCQLRTDMLRVYYRHKDDKVIRQYEKENFEHNFHAYTALGGNSFIVDIHDEVKKWEIIS